MIIRGLPGRRAAWPRTVLSSIGRCLMVRRGSPRGQSGSASSLSTNWAEWASSLLYLPPSLLPPVTIRSPLLIYMSKVLSAADAEAQRLRCFSAVEACICEPRCLGIHSRQLCCKHDGNPQRQLPLAAAAEPACMQVNLCMLFKSLIVSQLEAELLQQRQPAPVRPKKGFSRCQAAATKQPRKQALQRHFSLATGVPRTRAGRHTVCATDRTFLSAGFQLHLQDPIWLELVPQRIALQEPFASGYQRTQGGSRCELQASRPVEPCPLAADCTSLKRRRLNSCSRATHLRQS